MALPTPVKTWQYNVNQTINTGNVVNNNKTILLNMKNALKGFASTAWTMLYSCTSAVAGSAGDGVDRWSTIADIVFNSAGSAHSWAVLKQAGLLTNAQLLISASSEGGGSYNAANFSISLYFSPSAGFTGGTTTARPTATDEIILSATGFSGGGLGGTAPSAATPLRLHFQQATDGACTRMVMCASSTACVLLILDQVANGVSGWSNPFFVGMGFSGNAVFPTVNGASLAQWTSLTAANGTLRGLKIGATAGSAILTAEGNGTILSPADTAYGNLANEVDGLWPIYPIGLASPTVGIRGRHGTLIDAWFGSSASPTGDTYDLTSKTFAQFGNFILPWDGASAVGIT